MLLVLACLFATAAAGTINYDKRQDGDYNAQVDISNLLFVFAIPKKMPSSLFNVFSKHARPLLKNHDIQERADVRLMEAFVEPNTPYHVDIGIHNRSENDGRAAEVVIPGRRRLEIEPHDDLKLLGSTENCGPDRIRDNITLMCKDINPNEVNAVPDTPTEQTEKNEGLQLEDVPS